MKKALVVLMMFFFFSPGADACVGKMLYIGVLNSAEGQVFSEMISALISERTGTTVSTRFYKNAQELYDAVKVKQVDILVENTARALTVLNKPAEADARKAFETVKTAYEKEKGLVWLKPYGFMKAGGTDAPCYTSTLLRADVINNFPALPRVMEKLGSMVNDEAYAKLLKSVEAGEKPKKVARDFLKSKKLL